MAPISTERTIKIIAKEQSLMNAMKDNDVQILDELLHKDLLFNIPNGKTLSKVDDLETYHSGNMQINSLIVSNQQINIIDDVAVVAVTIEMKGKYFGHKLDGKYRILRIWKLFADKWKVIGGSSFQFQYDYENII